MKSNEDKSITIQHWPNKVDYIIIYKVQTLKTGINFNEIKKNNQLIKTRAITAWTIDARVKIALFWLRKRLFNSRTPGTLKLNHEINHSDLVALLLQG